MFLRFHSLLKLSTEATPLLLGWRNNRPSRLQATESFDAHYARRCCWRWRFQAWLNVFMDLEPLRRLNNSEKPPSLKDLAENKTFRMDFYAKLAFLWNGYTPSNLDFEHCRQRHITHHPQIMCSLLQKEAGSPAWPPPTLAHEQHNAVYVTNTESVSFLRNNRVSVWKIQRILS